MIKFSNFTILLLAEKSRCSLMNTLMHNVKIDLRVMMMSKFQTQLLLNCHQRSSRPHPLWGARSLTSHAWRFIFHRALQEPRFLNGKIIFFYFNAFIFRKGNCFTTRCWFLPYINMSQPQVQMCPLPAESPSPLPPHPTPLGCYRAPI